MSSLIKSQIKQKVITDVGKVNEELFYKQFDKDKNSYITRAEFGDFIIKEYEITKPQRTAFMKGLIAGMFEASDGKGMLNMNDAQLNRKEFLSICSYLLPYSYLERKTKLRKNPFAKTDEQLEKVKIDEIEDIVHIMRPKTDLFLYVIFKLIDKNDSNSVDVSEIKDFLNNMRVVTTKTQVKNKIESYTNEDGKIGFPEFVKFMISMDW